ncbi:MAG: hypothetical protein OEO83_14640 [Alphaproteobacteria bacterium]|nr:hypothetical protein [Alphaproteobacteria bacterium]
MAKLVGCVAMSHGPQLMLNPDQWDLLHKGRGKIPPVRADLAAETQAMRWDKWNRCVAAIEALRAKVESWAPDLVIIVSDDQHENILDGTMPPFTIYIGEAAEASVSLRYLGQPKSENRTAYAMAPALARGMLEDLMNAGFDPAYAKMLEYEGGLGHGFARILKFLTPKAELPVIPVMVNTYHPPAPSATRCVAFGRALAAAIGAMKDADKVVVIGSGGLSHPIIDEDLDHRVLDAIGRGDMDFLASMESGIFRAGTSEILNWIVTAAAAPREGTVVDYVPCYRTPTGIGCAMGFAHW